MLRVRSAPLLFAFAILVSMLVAAPAARSDTTEFGYQRPGINTLVSVARDGIPGDGRSYEPDVSADGRYVVFSSRAQNLVDHEVHRDDIFRRDLLTGETEVVSVAADGGVANFWSLGPAVSADGSVVAFTSYASNLDPADDVDGPYVTAQVYVRDMYSGETIRISDAPDPNPDVGSVLGSFAPSVSGDGRRVAFQASRVVSPNPFVPPQPDIYVYDRPTGTRERISVAHDGGETDDGSENASLNHDGRYVAFDSEATNLLPGAGPHSASLAQGRHHIYVRDVDSGDIELVSTDSDGIPGNHDSTRPSISADGRYVAFQGTAYNLVPEDTNAPDFDPGPHRFMGGHDIFVRDRLEGTTERVSLTSSGEEGYEFVGSPSISADGRYVALDATPLGSASNGIYIHDRATGATELASVTPQGSPSVAGVWQPALSADAVTVVFTATNPSDLFEDDAGPHFGVVVRRRGAGIGVHDLAVSGQDDGLLVRGLAGFSGITVAEASAPPTPGDVRTGPVLRRASLVFRPEQGDLLARLQLDRLPAVYPNQDVIDEVPHTTITNPNAASVSRAVGGTYGLGFDLDGVRYQVRADRAGSLIEDGELPGFSLHRCEITCELVTTLAGGYGTPGHEVRIALPLNVLDLTPGSDLTGLVAFVGEREVPSGDLAPGVNLALGDVELPEVSVRVGVLPEGVSPDESSLGTMATLARGVFTAELPVPAGDNMRLWARACVGGQCGSASVPLTLEEMPVEVIDTNLELTVEGRGQDTTLMARLTELDAPQSPVVGRTIDFYSDDELIGSEVTDADGVATIALPPGHRGANRTYEAVFEGDDLYGGSADNHPGRGGGQGGETSKATQAGGASRGAVFIL